MAKKKLIRTSTVASTLAVFCKEQINRLKKDFDVTIVTSDGYEVESLREIGDVELHIVNMERRMSPLKDLMSLWKMYSLFRKVKPDIVHSVTPKAGLVSMLAAKLAGVKHRVHTFTGLIWPTTTRLKRGILIAADRLLCACATDVIPESNGVRRQMEDSCITSKPLKILHHGSLRGIDLTYYSADARFEKAVIRNRKRFTFIFIGRIVADKGIKELVSAFDSLSKRHDDISLLLVGQREDTLDPIDENTSDIISSNKNIIEIGPVRDVRQYLAVSDTLVLPSYREGLPNVVIEAGAMSLPCIASDIPGSNDIIESNVNGLLVPVHDYKALESAMEHILEDGSLRTRLANNARKIIASRYDKDDVYRALLEFYNSLD